MAQCFTMRRRDTLLSAAAAQPVVLLVLALGVAALAGSAPDRPLAHTKLGDLRGLWLTSAEGLRYAAFTGVPYAQPPVGALRFEAPKQLKAWTGEWDAGQEAPDCMAYSHLLGEKDKTQGVRIKGQEDCLYLNVYTPKVPTPGENEAPRDVIVYIHGGAFMFGGSSAYGAKRLVDRNVILVTLNYRLGPLGFLSLGDEVQPGNHGLRDQVTALQWVQHHIAAFGGNPKSVTLSGCSAGGASVHYHYLSPLSKGLFASGISMSGTTLVRWALAERAREKALQLAASLGCPTDRGSRHVIECLRQRPAQRIVEQVEQFQVWQYSPFTPFGPVVEVATKKGMAPFLPDWPVRILQAGKASRAPWVTGVTTAEGLYPAAAFVADKAELALLDRDFERLVPHLLDFNFTVPAHKQPDVVTVIRAEYFGTEPVGDATVYQLIKLIGDRLFVVDAQRAAELQAQFSPVFFYQFDFRGKHSLSDLMSDTHRDFGETMQYDPQHTPLLKGLNCNSLIAGVSHADDASYFLNVSYIADEPRSGMEKKVETMMLDFWTSFAQTGVPEAPGVSWSPVTPGGDLELLHIDQVPPTMAHAADLGNAKFWESLPLQEAPQSLAHLAAKDEL